MPARWQEPRRGRKRFGRPEPPWPDALAGMGAAERPNEQGRFRLRLTLDDNTKPRPERDQVYKTTFSDLQCPLLRLYNAPRNNGYIAVTDNMTFMDKLLSRQGQAKLKTLNLRPVLPPDVRAKRTVFLRQLDRHVRIHTEDELLTELRQRNEGLRLTEVGKIRDYTHVIKLICGDVETADKIVKDGLYCYHVRISAGQCKKEEFVPLQTCFRCYAYDDHDTKNCPKTITVCSECTGPHRHQDCQSDVKKCINCSAEGLEANHRTLAAQCPIRKRATMTKLQKQTDDIQRQQTATFATIAKEAAKETCKEQIRLDPPRQTTPTPTIINLTDKVQYKMMALILEAHIAALTDQGSFPQILRESLRLNFDIDVQFPDRDSQKIFNAYMNRPTIDEDQPSTRPSTEEDKPDHRRGLN